MLLPPPTATRSDPPARPLVVEFVGLPGAGKTTVSRRVVAQQRWEGRVCGHRRQLGRGHSSRLVHYASKAAFHVRHRQHLPAALQVGLTVRPRSLSSALHAVALASWAYGLRVARERQLELLILDQGPLQEAWSVIVAGEHWDRRAMCRVLGGILVGSGLPFAFVHLHVDVELAIDRIRQRSFGGSRFDSMSDVEAKRVLTAHRADLEVLIGDAAAITGAAARTIDGSLPLDTLCAAVAEFIDGIAPALSAPAPHQQLARRSGQGE